MITVAIVEDNRLVREGITHMLNELPDVEVVLATTSFETAMLKKANPRVVLLDIGLHDTNCLSAAETLRKEMVDSQVIVMDLLPVHEEIAEFVNVGVAGFILKDATFEDFVGTIRSVAEGERVLPPRMTHTLFSQIAQVAVQRGRVAALEAVHMTQREREVIALIADGMSNKEIAQGSQHRNRHGEESRAKCHGEAGSSHSVADSRLRASAVRPDALTPGRTAPEAVPQLSPSKGVRFLHHFHLNRRYAAVKR